MRNFFQAQLACALALLTLAGCSSSPSDEGWPEARPIGGKLEAFRAGGFAPDSDAPAIDATLEIGEHGGVLSLEDAWRAALLKNPRLATFAWDVRAAEARTLQAGLRPNPEAGLSVENFGGSGEVDGSDVAESTLGISQLIELGGKRKKRRRAAELESQSAGWDYEARRVAVLTEVAQRFIGVAAAQRRLELARQNAELSTEVRDAVEKQVKAGSVSPIERDRQKVETVNARVALQRAEKNLVAARYRLAATWGDTAPSFESVSGNLFEVRPLPPFEALSGLVAQNPEIARWTTEIAQRRAATELAVAQAAPDFNAGAGARHFNETDDLAAVVEFSIPLPIFDRNQGGILEARAGVAKALQEQRAAEVEIRVELAAAYQELAAAYAEATALRDEALPAAERAFSNARAAFQRGQFDYLTVLDAQRTFIETSNQYADALADYHGTLAEVEGLIGQSIATLPSEASTPSKEPNDNTAPQP